MKLFNHLYQDVFFRVLDATRGRRTIEKLKFLRQSQYWNRKQIETWQLSRINELLQIANKQSLFYAGRFSDFQLQLKSLNELQKFPILTKKDIRHNLDTILCVNVKKSRLELSKTGGSTGEPSFYYLDQNSKDWNRGSVYRSAEWADVFLGDKTVQMNGSHFDLTEFSKLKWKIIFALQRYKDLSVATVSDEILDQYFHTIQSYKPTTIWGYASGQYLFSRFIEEHYPNAEFDFLKAIITSSETLRPEWRIDINRVFGGSKVYDHYGSREAYLASECKEHNGYHIHSEVIYLEVVDSEGQHVAPGEKGRILVTDLSNLAFPFIRYEIGDVGKLSPESPCPCGVTLPKLQTVEGRIADIITLKDRQLAPPNFTLLMSDFEGIEQYQILQKNMSELTAKIVKNSKYNQDMENYVKNSLQKLVGSDVNIQLDYVDEIEVPKSGKRRYVISEIGLK